MHDAYTTTQHTRHAYTSALPTHPHSCHWTGRHHSAGPTIIEHSNNLLLSASTLPRLSVLSSPRFGAAYIEIDIESETKTKICTSSQIEANISLGAEPIAVKPLRVVNVQANELNKHKLATIHPPRKRERERGALALTGQQRPAAAAATTTTTTSSFFICGRNTCNTRYTRAVSPPYFLSLSFFSFLPLSRSLALESPLSSRIPALLWCLSYDARS
ncbi:hypothetical protein F5Y14DRAFT_215618 [Nemania sp. NC0429]|nr:hypothetical protein F5Y14DRAFT_215618 [Nemania sp. NC0429]